MNCQYALLVHNNDFCTTIYPIVLLHVIVSLYTKLRAKIFCMYVLVRVISPSSLYFFSFIRWSCSSISQPYLHHIPHYKHWQYIRKLRPPTIYPPTAPQLLYIDTILRYIRFVCLLMCICLSVCILYVLMCMLPILFLQKFPILVV